LMRVEALPRGKVVVQEMHQKEGPPDTGGRAYEGQDGAYSGWERVMVGASWCGKVAGVGAFWHGGRNGGGWPGRQVGLLTLQAHWPIVGSDLRAT
jgi:hypothetical protein